MRQTFLKIAAGAVLLAGAGAAEAGQFKRLNGTALLGIGGSINTISSPQNQNIAMEGDTFEFLTANVPVSTWTCGITSNTTGRALTVRMISLIGSVLQTCTSPVNGTCTTPAQGLGGNFLFQCTVFAPGAGSPVVVGSTYGLAVSRIAPFSDGDGATERGTAAETGIFPDEGKDD